MALGANPNPARITEASWWFHGEQLAMDPGTVTGGVYFNKPGYHGTRAQNIARDGYADYSVRDAVDRLGPADKTAGYDKIYPEAKRGDYRRMLVRGQHVKRAFLARDPRLSGWREYLGQTEPDREPEGLDFRTWTTRVPDISHEWHDHTSENREQAESYANKRAMLSVMRGETLAHYLAEEALMLLIRRDKDPAVWLADGMVRRHVVSPAQLTAIQAAHAAGYLPLKSAKVAIVPEGADLDVYGLDLRAGQSAMDPATVAALAAAISERLTVPDVALSPELLIEAFNAIDLTARPKG